MNFHYNSETKLTDVGIELDDICLFCNFSEGGCPLIGALEENIVYPSANRLNIEEK